MRPRVGLFYGTVIMTFLQLFLLSLSGSRSWAINIALSLHFLRIGLLKKSQLSPPFLESENLPPENVDLDKMIT